MKDRIVGYVPQSSTIRRMLEEVKECHANSCMIYIGNPTANTRSSILTNKYEDFKQLTQEYKIDVVLHAPYVINFAGGINSVYSNSLTTLLNQLKMSASLGIKDIIIHSGSATNSVNTEESYLDFLYAITEGEIAETIKKYNLNLAIENMVGSGTQLFADLNAIFKFVKDANEQTESNNYSVCLDLCHMHDAGYDIGQSLAKNFSDEHKKLITVMHIAGSKNVRGSKRDRHEKFVNTEASFLKKEQIMGFINELDLIHTKHILEIPYSNLEDVKNHIEIIKQGG